MFPLPQTRRLPLPRCWALWRHRLSFILVFSAGNSNSLLFLMSEWSINARGYHSWSPSPHTLQMVNWGPERWQNTARGKEPGPPGFWPLIIFPSTIKKPYLQSPQTSLPILSRLVSTLFHPSRLVSIPLCVEVNSPAPPRLLCFLKEEPTSSCGFRLWSYRIPLPSPPTPHGQRAPSAKTFSLLGEFASGNRGALWSQRHPGLGGVSNRSG